MSHSVKNDTAQFPRTLWGNVAIDLINLRKPAPFPTATLPALYMPAFYQVVILQRDTLLPSSSVLPTRLANE